MATITASLERSLQNCSLGRGRRGRGGRPTSSDHRHHRPAEHHHPTEDATLNSNTLLELNSHVSLPYHWEQCLDLKTGEIYYINWSNGMKMREDPRTTTAGYNGDYDSEEEDEEGEEDDDNEDDDDDDDDGDEDEDEDEETNGYNSEGSSRESYSSLRSSLRKLVMGGGSTGGGGRSRHEEIRKESILVVAGCKSCLMYHMVAKHVEVCPKCCGQLLHLPPNPNPNPNPTSSP